MMKRKLASIQRVVELTPIPGADKIECARILGWDCVVQKGKFVVGDLGVFIEIDSILPVKPVFEFMRDKKFRVQTIRLRKQISQGLFMPLEDFPEIKHPKEDMDVTRILGITKYEPPETEYKSMAAKKKPWWFYVLVRIPFLRRFVIRPGGERSAFPINLVPETDEIRLQALAPDFLEQHKDVRVSITRKMDGSSLTIFWYKNKVSVASRNVWFPRYRANRYWDFVKDLHLEVYMKHGANVAIQGELCGPGIQGNKYKFDRPKLFVFGIYDITTQQYLTPDELCQFMYHMKVAGPDIHCVPLIKHDVIIGEIGTTVEDWLTLSKTRNAYNEETWDEGIVVRSVDNKPYGTKCMNGRRFSFKVINPEFLLQYGL